MLNKWKSSANQGGKTHKVISNEAGRLEVCGLSVKCHDDILWNSQNQCNEEEEEELALKQWERSHFFSVGAKLKKNLQGSGK